MDALLGHDRRDQRGRGDVEGGIAGGNRVVTSAPSRSSIGIAAPFGALGSIVELGATIRNGIWWWWASTASP